MFESEIHVALWGHQLQAVAHKEFVFHRNRCQWTFALAGELPDKLLALGKRVAIFIVLVIVMGMTTQEAFGVATVCQPFQCFQQGRVERFTRRRVVDRLAVDLGGTRAVVIRFGAALDLQRVHAHLGQALNVGDGAQIFGVHDVGAVLIFERRHVFARTLGLFNHKHAVGWRTQT